MPLASQPLPHVARVRQKRKRRQLMQSRLQTATQSESDLSNMSHPTQTPHRILAQRDFDDGAHYLVHWRGSTASDAQWVTANVLGSSLLYVFPDPSTVPIIAPS